MSNKYKHFDEAMPSGMLNTSMESKPPLNQAIKQKYSIKVSI